MIWKHIEAFSFVCFLYVSGMMPFDNIYIMSADGTDVNIVVRSNTSHPCMYL